MRPDLIARYADQRLPRYTSYPTAPHFSGTIGPGTYAEWLAATPAGTPASLYVHVPFCRRMCWYCGCNTAVTLRDEPVAAYGEMLKTEIGLVRAHLGKRLPAVHLHFGGGTPTIMAPALFRDLMALLHETFDFRRQRRTRHRDRPAHAHPRDGGGNGRLRHQPRQPRRAEPRPGGAEGDQPGAEL